VPKQAVIRIGVNPSAARVSSWTPPNSEYLPPKPGEPPLHRAARVGRAACPTVRSRRALWSGGLLDTRLGILCTAWCVRLRRGRWRQTADDGLVIKSKQA